MFLTCNEANVDTLIQREAPRFCKYGVTDSTLARKSRGNGARVLVIYKQGNTTYGL